MKINAQLRIAYLTFPFPIRSIVVKYSKFSLQRRCLQKPVQMSVCMRCSSHIIAHMHLISATAIFHTCVRCKKGRVWPPTSSWLEGTKSDNAMAAVTPIIRNGIFVIVALTHSFSSHYHHHHATRRQGCHASGATAPSCFSSQIDQLICSCSVQIHAALV